MPHLFPLRLRASNCHRSFVQDSFHFSRAKVNGALQTGFTLIEVLVATSVLTLMVLMITALMDSASLTVTSSGRHIAADEQARQVFDRMQVDFARMLKRNDVYFQFLKQTGNDSFTFYSETPGYFSAGTASAEESNLSLINYQISNNSSNQPELLRLGEGVQWNNIVFSPTGSVTPPSSNHILSNSIFRMESAFLYRTSNTSLEITGTAPTAGSGFQNLEAIIVALGVLDSDSQKMVPATAYPTLISALADYSGTQTIQLNPTPPLPSPAPATIDPILSTWRTAITASNFAQTAGIPAAAARQVRVYQRIIYLQ
jgi:prepilin-type N-terminal cleavage/methylation domain-containing protein